MNALSPSRPDRPLHGLWSLWQMLELNTAAFYAAINGLGRVHGIIDGQSELNSAKLDDSIIEEFRKRLADVLKNNLIPHLVVLNCRIAAMAANDMFEKLQTTVSFGQCGDCLEDIDRTFRRELISSKCLVLEPDKQKYFIQDEPLFGDNFNKKFVAATFELDEAGKCFALGRPTASVFHLMRLMEIGINATARCLGIPDPVKPAERNWGNILRRMWEGIERKWPTTADRAVGDGALFESLHASLDAVKNPWRNATMHVENKYTDDEAEHIFVAVRGFMTKLASRCDENGDPKA